MKQLRTIPLVGLLALTLPLALLPAASAAAVPTPPTSLTAVATTSSSVVLDWTMGCSSCDPTQFDIQAGVPGLPWTFSTTRTPYIGAGYSVLETSKPANFLTYTPELPHSGTWRVEYNVPNLNSSSLVTATTIDIVHAGVTSQATMNQRYLPGAGWQVLGSYSFDAGRGGSVTIRNAGTGGTYVLADGFKFVDSTGLEIVVDDSEASNANWQDMGDPSGAEREFTVGHLSSGLAYAFRIRSTTAGVSSAWVTSSPVTTPAKNSEVRATIVVPTGVDNPRNGEGDIIELSDGSLLYVYGRYEQDEDFADATIAAKTSSDGGRTWSSEFILFGSIGADQTYIQPSLVRIDADTIAIAFVIQEESGGATIAHRVFSTSDDDGATWSTPVVQTDGSSSIITAANARLIALSNGDLLQVVNLRLPTASSRSTGIYTSSDDGATWTNRTSGSAIITAPGGFIEATVVETSPGRLLLMGRQTVGAQGYLWQSVSTDYGATWSAAERTDVKQPNSPAFLAKLPSGGIVLISNGDTAQGTRTILASRISTDEGATWTNYRQLEYKTPSKASYPALTFAADGAHLIYSTPVGTGEASHLALPSDWFTTVSSYPYAPSTIAHFDGTDVVFSPVSGGQGAVVGEPRVTVDGVSVTPVAGRITLPTGTHTVAWSAIDAASREEVWQSASFTR